MAILEKREIDIQRKYRLQYQKWQDKLKLELEKKKEDEITEMKTTLQD